MNSHEPAHILTEGEVTGDRVAHLLRCEVLAIAENGDIITRDTATGEQVVVAETAQGGDDLRLTTGAVILVFRPVAESTGICLGEVRSLSTSAARGPRRVAAQVTLEAIESLTLKVGNNSITIRKDGKILIKGTDVVSHARRMNRVKGGAVSIN